MFLKKTDNYAKAFFIVSLCGLKIYAIIAFYTFTTAQKNYSQVIDLQENLKQSYPKSSISDLDRDLKLRYILLWTTNNNSENSDITDFSKEGQIPFVQNNCKFANCIITTKKELLDGDYTKFDAIVINVTNLKKWKKLQMPMKRSSKQKYIFHGMLPADEYPICNSIADNYFNLTWSYKLYSDIFAPFVEVKYLNGSVVAPRPNVHWEVNESARKEAAIKKPNAKAMVWIINKCGKRTDVLDFVRLLKMELQNLGHILDVYGCGNLKYDPDRLNDVFAADYYFYLVYEDSLTEDYLTADIVKAYDNHVVPVVISGADLNKFLPPKSYIDARRLTAHKIAAHLDFIIRRPIVYNSFQRWRELYTIHAVESSRGICDLCALVNNDSLMKTHSHYELFRKWWYNGSTGDYCFTKSFEKNRETISNSDSRNRSVGNVIAPRKEISTLK